MLVYLIEALDERDSCSAIKSWKSKIKQHPEIKKAVTKFIHKQGRTLENFSAEISSFVRWLPEFRASNPSELIILWLSVHGAMSKIGVKFDNGDEGSMCKILSPLNTEMSGVILMQSICWGSLPTTTFAMNRRGFGPRLIFGSTIEVRIPKLKYAEIEIFKLLASTPDATPVELCRTIDAINERVERDSIGYERYYRVWFWDEDSHRPKCHPQPVNNRPRLVTNPSFNPESTGTDSFNAS